MALDGLSHTSDQAGEVGSIDNNLIKSCTDEAKKLVNKAYFNTRTSLKERLDKKTVSPYDLMAYFKQAVAESRNFIRAADYMAVTLQLLADRVKRFHQKPFNITDLLTYSQMENISKISGCDTQLNTVCTDGPYRTITGECNNRKNPRLGASNTGFTRLLPASYEDGVSLPRGWTENKAYNGFSLPLVRAVSNEIVRFPIEYLTLDEGRALIFMQWGQWVDHDLDLTPAPPSTSTSQGVNCDTSCVQDAPCFPVKIPPNDPRISNQSDCIPFTRSGPACTKDAVREQMNALTSYIDGNQVYGSNLATAERLRNRTNQMGLMAINQNFTDNGLPLLPFDTINGGLCVTTNASAGIPCFLAGDVRVNEQPGLLSFHTLFVREHNRIATELHRLNPTWSEEILYQETRKVIGAILQKITYKDWLPLLLGSEMSTVLPPYRSYSESVDPRVANVFTIAFRMGHTLIQPFIYRLGEGYRPHMPEPQVPIHKTFFTSWRIVKEGGIDPLLRGLLANHAKLNIQNQIMVDELRERLFQFVRRIGLDLASLNMQRGRDHGLPGYNAWRRFCGLSAPRDLNELAAVLNNRELAEKFMKLYGTPENIDIWVGGVSEPQVPGGRIGKLLSCLIGNQFQRARDGDRFFYENPSVFTAAQRKSIEQVTLARVICENTNIKEVPQNVFMGNDYPRDFLNCSNISALDLSPWKSH
ncbi:myeloperoxidase-like [Spea bombifrons]|uniref:myeloperoxidase-like n=1 Tax=Spea bombifrons TaxID=233779 RepID=UPI0023491D67|nr:myeloperoxidase-like [Spea bombifrons]